VLYGLPAGDENMLLVGGPTVNETPTVPPPPGTIVVKLFQVALSVPDPMPLFTMEVNVTVPLGGKLVEVLKLKSS
jgi:hypothetical protein